MPTSSDQETLHSTMLETLNPHLAETSKILNGLDLPALPLDFETKAKMDYLKSLREEKFKEYQDSGNFTKKTPDEKKKVQD